MGYKTASPRTVSEGGTGVSTITSHGILVGNDTSALTVVSTSSTSGISLVSNGSSIDPSFTTISASGGGTGQSSLTLHTILVGNDTSPINFSDPTGVVSGVPLVSTGSSSDPSFTTMSVSGGGTGLSSLTANNMIIGAGTSAVTLVAPSSTSGVPLVSTGSSSDPSFTTAVVAGGGTGSTSFDVYSLVSGGTTTTDPLQSASTGQSTSGYIMSSNGSSSTPTWKGIIDLPATTSSVGQVVIATGSATSPVIQATGTNNTLMKTTNTTLTGTDNTGRCPQMTSGSRNTLFAPGVTGGTQNTCSSGDDNVGIGASCISGVSTASFNAAIGSLIGIAAGSKCSALGNCLSSAKAFVSCTVIGSAAGNGAVAAFTNNVIIGTTTGQSLAGTSINNVFLNGSNRAITISALSIGAGTGTGSKQLNSAYISGIQGITVTGSAMLVSATDQLGVLSSTQRVKENIKDLDDKIIDNVLKLRPVTFNYNVGSDYSLQGGLIAEEVDTLIPSLMVYDQSGLPQTVKYHDLSILLIAQLQKALKRIEILEQKIALKMGV